MGWNGSHALDGTRQVTFVENEDGEVALRSVKRPTEFRNALATDTDRGDEKCPPVALREERRRGSERVAETFGADSA